MRILFKAATKKYHVQKEVYIGGYDYMYTEWVDCTTGVLVTKRFLGISYKRVYYIKDIFDTEEEAKVCLDKKIELRELRELAKDRVVWKEKDKLDYI